MCRVRGPASPGGSAADASLASVGRAASIGRRVPHARRGVERSAARRGSGLAAAHAGYLGRYAAGLRASVQTTTG